MAINEIFREMFSEQKRERELKFQQEIIRKTLEDQGYNINDFDTAGEMTKWMEKRGWRNTFYDGESRDIVDETLKNFENFNQRLYTNESNIAEQIEQRIKNLQSAANMENYYDTDKNYDLDAFERDGLEQLFSNESDEFVADLSRDGGDADDEE